MTNSIMLGKVADAVASIFYDELIKAEDFSLFESIVYTDMRSVAAGVLGRCIERFDADVVESAPRGWTVHERSSRTLITLVGEVTFMRTVFLDEYGRRRILTDELLGIPPRSRLSNCAFLWIATHASELSYRKTAEEFKSLTAVEISHVSVMNVVHREGRLLKERGGEYAATSKISQEELFLESDGLWVHVQENQHRDHVIPRFLYEQARKTKSFELKIAALYAGKKEVAPGRFERGGLCLTCSDEEPDAFWNRVWDMLCTNYEEQDIKRIAIGADGADWCGPQRIKAKVDSNCSVDFTLDLFHIMQKITQAFPDENSKERDCAINLALRGCGEQLAKMANEIAHTTSKNKREKMLELASYVANHLDGICPVKHELGTMEGTNAHIGAARLKGQGRSWSRRGAEAMCLIRCAIKTERPLIPLPLKSWFTKNELKAKEAYLAKSAGSIPKTTGSGYMLPIHQLSKSAAISLSFRS